MESSTVLTVDKAKTSVGSDDLALQHVACYVCNGFYGPSFEEPVCTTCHAFLFPETWNEKIEDGDSGNDEPNEVSHSSSGHQNASANLHSHNEMSINRPLIISFRPHLRLTASPSSVKPPNDVSVSLLESLPPEVLLAVFSYLDDMSLWSVGNVCKRWRHLLQSHLSDDVWRSYTKRRFPIYKPYFAVKNWFQVFSKLINSCPCKSCLLQTALEAESPREENTWRRNRLLIELRSLRMDLPQGIEAIPLDRQCFHWQASITGPVGSPYEGGLFYLSLLVPSSYPMEPPTVKFITRIFHPNVSRHGDIGIDSKWSLALTIPKVLLSVQSLLTDPYCEVCMEPGIGRLYINDKEAFTNIARDWTWKYAMHDILSP